MAAKPTETAITIDAKTGEVYDPSESPRVTDLATINQTVLSRVAALANAKASDLDFATEPTFFSFKADGDELRGVYLGTGHNGKMLQHLFATPSKDPKRPERTVINGIWQVTKAAEGWTPGKTAVVIRRTGTKATPKGKTIQLAIAVLDA